MNVKSLAGLALAGSVREKFNNGDIEIVGALHHLDDGREPVHSFRSLLSIEPPHAGFHRGGLRVFALNKPGSPPTLAR